MGGIFDAERLRGLEVDDQLELGRLLHRQVDRLSLPFQVSTLHGDVAWRCALVSTTDRWATRLGGLDDRNKSAQGQPGEC